VPYGQRNIQGAFDLYQKSVKKILKDLQNPHHFVGQDILNIMGSWKNYEFVTGTQMQK